MQNERQRRHEERTRLGGSIRLLLDTPGGLLTTTGQIIDLSSGGCAIRVHRKVDPELVGRVQLEVAGHSMWLPVTTRWARSEANDWIVGCEFDRPTPEKQLAIRTLLLERRRLTA
jgi:PilZ domain